MAEYQLQSYHVTHEDHFENGEGEYCTCYHVNGNVEADSFDEAIEKYFDEVLYYTYNKAYASYDDECEILNYSVLVDEDQDEVSQDSNVYEEWKAGNIKLWSNQISIKLRGDDE